MHNILWYFEIQNDHPITARKLDLVLIHKKKRIYNQVDFVVPADDRVNIKESEKFDRYVDLAKEVEKS